MTRKSPQENTEWGVKPMRYYLEGAVFGVICILLIKLLLGNRMKIPRLGFIAWAEGKKEEETQ